MKSGVIISIVLAILILGGIIYYFSQSAGTGNKNTATGADVQIQSFSFSPSILTVKVGDTVTWTNLDSAPHTVTSDSGTELNSQNLDREGIYSHEFTVAGTYEYHCAYHPSMKAKIIVE